MFDDTDAGRIPSTLEDIEYATRELGFDMPSERKTGALLRTLVASKPGGHMLELGTGTGLAASWIIAGLNKKAVFTTLDNDPAPLLIARKYLGEDVRTKIIETDAASFLEQGFEGQFDLIFADAWPGKYSHLDEALNALAFGGFYVIDDMLPQANWPEGHQAHVDLLMATLRAREDIVLVPFDWASGVVVAVKRA